MTAHLIFTLFLIIYSTTEAKKHDGCKMMEYQCKNGTCIPFHYLCDGHDDCIDASDEDICSKNNFGIHPRWFICRDKGHIEVTLRCDGIKQCKDGSDETNCPSNICPAVTYRCNNNACLYGSKVDMQGAWCKDRSDETLKNLLKNANKFSAYSFKCHDGNVIDAWSRCDGYKNCRDNTDELNCKPTVCKLYQKKCSNNKCIEHKEVCNGKNDCGDNSDEVCQPPSCSENDHMCGNGQCLKKSVICDGVRHCIEGSDEWNCPTREPCPSCFYTCTSGQCVHVTKRCNGLLECGDGSDEWHCGNFKLEPNCPFESETTVNVSSQVNKTEDDSKNKQYEIQIYNQTQEIENLKMINKANELKITNLTDQITHIQNLKQECEKQRNMSEFITGNMSEITPMDRIQNDIIVNSKKIDRIFMKLEHMENALKCNEYANQINKLVNIVETCEQKLTNESNTILNKFDEVIIENKNEMSDLLNSIMSQIINIFESIVKKQEA